MSGVRARGAREAQATGRSAVRLLGAAVFATVCVYAALGTHVLAGGSGASLGVVAATTVAAGAGAYLLGRRRRGRGVLVAASFAAQYGMHQVFSADIPDAAHVLGHGAGHHGGGPLPGVAMPLAHVLVAVLCAWWLERGETALVTVLVLLGCSLAGLSRPSPRGPLTPAPLRIVPAAGEPPVRGPQVLAWAVSHRGPPR
ncbi:MULTISPECIES: hypothetical protein [Nonomuraea]|uniref:MFS transporter n=1 Tax=Nonomuraea ferruginea TaxID=46174 RepID=A0ABT4T3T0_9ACTN|nr:MULTISPECIES: hypothetical protein [Nonomuraea]MDA0644137.1 hypothetical protein [Nonomuraea ferruginea]TXK40350.1 hypothetical protein FR742_12745 [Nonomuraea sp. C10]